MTIYARLLLTTLLLGSTSYVTLADDAENFNYYKIPSELLKNADAVVRKYHREIEIVSTGEVNITDVYAITVLNEKGMKFAQLEEGYDKLVKITDLEGWLYDKNGKEVEQMKKKNVRDMNAYSEISMSDLRIKTFAFNYDKFPYTCVFQVKTTQSFSFSLRSWQPQLAYDCAVESANLEVSYPSDIPVRYRTFHISTEPSVTRTNEGNKITLTINNIPARLKPDDLTPMDIYDGPSMIVAADKFAIVDDTGSMDSWQGFGKFFYELNAGRDELPKGTKKLIHQMTDSCHTTYSKINVLYDYLQKNTRYFNIALGIGGWQTQEASFVAEKGYGDCKALTNYMKAMLKEAGVTAYQALAYGGERDLLKMQLDFPFSAFNHVILCVPQPNDSIWLECTAKELPAGYLSSFTGNRYVLLLTSTGGYPVKTPGNNHNDNLMTRKADVIIAGNSDLKANISCRYTGSFWDKARWMATEPKTKMENYLNNEYAIPTYSLSNYAVSNKKDRSPEIDLRVELAGTGNVTASGSRLFVSPHIFKFIIENPSSYGERKEPFQLMQDFHVTDTIVMHLPGNYTLEGNKKVIHINNVFATYSSETYLNGNELMIVTNYDQNHGVYPAAKFADYIKLSHEINSDAVNTRLVLVKQN